MINIANKEELPKYTKEGLPVVTKEIQKSLAQEIRKGDYPFEDVASMLEKENPWMLNVLNNVFHSLENRDNAMGFIYGFSVCYQLLKERAKSINPMRNKPYTVAEIYEAAKGRGEDGFEVGIEGIIREVEGDRVFGFFIEDSTGKIPCSIDYQRNEEAQLMGTLRRFSKKNMPLKIDGYVLCPPNEEIFLSIDVIYPEPYVQFRMEV